MTNIFVIILLFFSIAKSQSYKFENFGTEDGLSQQSVQVIFQDSESYLWIGTQAGLNRFNGRTFEIFSISDGLGNDRINDIAQDSSGSIWVATNNGISRWDNPGFTNFTLEHGLAGKRVTKLLVDKNGVLWCGTHKGINTWNGSSFSTVPILSTNKVVSINDFLLDNEKIWIATSRGLFVQENQSITDTLIHPDDNLVVKSVNKDNKERVWVGLSDEIRVYNKGKLVKKFNERNGLETISDYDIFVCSKGNTWVGMQHGVAKIYNNEIELITKKEGLPLFNVKRIIEDNEQTIWFGGEGGIVKYPGKTFVNYLPADGLGSRVVGPILRDIKNRLWVGTSEGLSVYNNHKWKNYSEKDGLLNKYISYLYYDQKNILWIGTYSGLNYFDGRSFKTYPQLKDIGIVRHIAKYAKNIVFSVEEKGVYNFNPENKKVSKITITGNELLNAHLLTDSNNNLWISGNDGLSRFDGQSWKTFTIKNGLTSNDPYYIVEDQSRAIWFGYHSSHGLTRFKNGNFKTFTTQDGLTNNAVYSIGADYDNNLWIGTAKGVDKFDGTYFKNYNVSDGYSSQESIAGGFFLDYDSTIWFGTRNGLIHYFPKKDKKSTKPAILKITKAELGGIRFSSDSLHSFDHEKNDLNITTECLSFGNNNRLKFEYRLLGFNDSWKKYDGHKISLINLKPNSYILEVRTKKYPQGWATPVRAQFIIKSPFWQTWWFISCSLAIAGLLIFSHKKYTAHSIERINRKIENDVLERTKELNKTKNTILHGKQELWNIFNSIPGIIYIKDINHKYINVNKAFLQATGKTKQEVCGKSAHDIFSKEEAMECDEEDRIVIREGKSYTFEKLQEFNNLERYHSITKIPISDSSGKITGIIGMDIDVHDFIEAKDRERESNKAKSEFLANMSHEIRTPMNGLIGMIALMEITQLDDEQSEFLELMKNSSESLLFLINDILDFSKIEAGKIEIYHVPFHLQNLIDEIIKIQGIISQNKGIDLKLEIDDKIPERLIGDPERLKQILINLVGNAVKFTKKGSVLLKVELENNLADKVTLKFYVFDTGIGLKKESVNKIFNSFTQADGSTTRIFGGTGLGLTISSQLVKLMGSRINVVSPLSLKQLQKIQSKYKASDYGPGSVFYFSVELQVQTKNEKQTMEDLLRFGKKQSTSKKGLKILLAEDNLLNQNVATKMLNKLGFKVTAVEDGRKVLHEIKNNSYDIILMDLHMPILDGIETTKRIREKEKDKNSHIPIIAVTANAMKGTKELCLESGMDSYITKPLRSEEIIDTINSIII